MGRLSSDESGFTLVELLVSMVIALAVSLATFTLVEVVMRRTGDIADRVDTTQRARTAMDQITRQLRSQVCTQRSDTGQAGRTIDAASPTSLTVFTDFSDETSNGGQLPAPDLRELTFNKDTKVLTEKVTTGKRATNGISVSYTNGTVKTRRILTNVVASSFADQAKTQPIFFRYYRYPSTGTVRQPTEEIAAGLNRALTADELMQIARISIVYKALTSKNKTAGATELKNDVYVRTSTPNADDPAKSKVACTAY